MSDDNKAWKTPGWPWELELLALLFVAVALAVPYHLVISGSETTGSHLLLPAGHPGATSWAIQSGFIWGLTIVGLYVFHLILARGTLDTISTPFTHLISPLLFGAIAYYRIYVTSEDKVQPVADGSASQIVLCGLAVVVITVLVARLRMARCLLTFRNVHWDLVTPTRVDSSFWGLLAQFEPMVYTPRLFRACDQGILIEGWLFILPIHFSHIHSLAPVNKASLAVAGHYFTTSAHSMIRIEYLDDNVPMFISPKNRDEFLTYCIGHVARHHPARKTRPGTASGSTTTHNGRPH